MARVYVSSTFTDLREHREAVRLAIRRLGHDDIAMEYYVAEDVRPVDRCLADVRSADLYIVIMAWRYGFIPPGHDKSITELEYRAALDADVPCLAFVLSDEQAWPPKLMERSPHVDDFRAELMEGRITGVFGSKDDLARQVGEGIQKWERADDTVATNIDWDAYRQAVVERYRWVRLSVIAGAQHDRMARIPLLDVFVPQQLRAGRPHYDLPADERGPALAEAGTVVLGRDRKQVILGGPGSGKSSLFQASLLAICDVVGDVNRLSQPWHELSVALLVELREYALSKCTDFLKHLRVSIWEKFNVRVTEAQLAGALDEGAVVFFDGLDEIFNRSARARVIDQFKAFTARFPHARVVVSSRIVGYDETELGLAGFKHYTLLDFGPAEIREFVPRWYEHYTLENDERDAGGLIHRITDNARMLELAGNPLLLTMMAVIYKHQDLPEKRWQLYERCTGVLLEDWDVKRKKIETSELLPLGFPLGRDQKAEILQGIAMTMLSSERGAGHQLNAIAYEPLRDIIAGYLRRQYAKPTGEAQAIAVEILDHLRERTYVLAEIGDRVFGFVHRTFMEYFAARDVLAEFNGRKADYGWLKSEVFLSHWSDEKWSEPLLLLSAMLAGQGSPIREIVDAVAADHPAALPFAARCLGEASLVPPEDRQWATGVAQRLVFQLAEIPSELRGAHLEEVAVALGSLSAFVTINEDTRRRIRAYRHGSNAQDRIIGFHLQLSIASRAERREASLAGLKDRDEAVRRAAVISLGREWTADETVLRALLDQLGLEANPRVRELIITAVDRGWPRTREVLDAIAVRMPREQFPEHAAWVAGHLAQAWAGDLEARALALRLAEQDERAVCGVVAQALVHGWRTTPDFVAFLLDEISGTEHDMVREAALRACVHVDLETLLRWFWRHSPTTVDLADLLRAARGRESAIMQWIDGVAEEHPDPNCRMSAETVRERIAGPHGS